MDWPTTNKEILSAIGKRFESGDWWSYKGKSVSDFEKRFAEFHDCKFGVSVCNGTVPLEIILRGFGVGQGDKVILPAHNFYSLPKSVSNVGATPVFVDVNKDNLTIDTEQVRNIIKSEAVKAVVAVHISSSVAKLEELSQMCQSAGAYLIEDCAQAAGAEYGGKRVGSWGDAGLFSFGGVKLMTSGQGGMITTSDRQLYEKCYAVVNRGYDIERKPNAFGIVGENYAMSELSAIVLGPQLDALEQLCARREEVMRLLDEQIESIDGLTALMQFEKTSVRAQMRYCFYYNSANFNGVTRDKFVQQANEKGVPLTNLCHKSVPNDTQLFHMYAKDKVFPVAETAEESLVSIWSWELLRGDEYWKEAVSKLRDVLR
ncbi:MAG: DegT/DnrJ/EryC1/StrS family aminotransferase [Planctomycetota bacterium]